MATDAANQAIPSSDGSALVAHSGPANFKGALKYIPTRCPGPAGTWPCSREFGHGGDHERFLPSSKSIRKADAAMALTARGLCPFCKSAVPDGEQCKCWNKEND